MLFPKTGNLFRLFRLGSTRIDYAREVGDGLGSSLVSATLLWIARTFPEAPPAVWPSDAPPGLNEPIKGHDLTRLLERPNPFFTGPLLWMATTTDWNSNGETYWITETNRLGVPIRLWWAPSWTMKPATDEGSSEFITHYELTIDGEPFRVDRERVVHFRYGSNPDDPRRGMSPLRALTREIFTDDEAANFTASLLRNMGVPGVIVSPDAEGAEGGAALTTAEAEDTKAKIAALWTGDRRGEVAVLTGKVKVEQFGFSPEQLLLRELRRIPEERVTAALGIPAVVVGLGAGLERSTFTNMGEAREAAYEAGLIPMQRILAEDVRFQLLEKFEDDPHAFVFGFDLSKVRVLQEDLYRQAQRLDLGVRGGWAQVAEARQAVGLPVAPADEIYLRQTSYVEVPAKGGPVRALTPSLNGGSTAGNGNGHLPRSVAEEVVRELEVRERLVAKAQSGRGGLA